MKNGVKYYLLKPCNELQIIDCIEQCKKDCYQQKLMERIVSDRFMAINSMNHNVIFSIINDSICQNRGFPDIIRSYESYIDFKFTVYRLYYVYFLPFEHLEEFLDDLSCIAAKIFPPSSSTAYTSITHCFCSLRTLPQTTRTWSVSSARGTIRARP